MFWTKEEREDLWQRDQIRFAEIAHEYLCCDVPTITQCRICTHYPDQCRNKAEVLRMLAEETPQQQAEPTRLAAEGMCPVCCALIYFERRYCWRCGSILLALR